MFQSFNKTLLIKTDPALGYLFQSSSDRCFPSKAGWWGFQQAPSKEVRLQPSPPTLVPGSTI